ncbi:hypothetical protein PIB30_099688, partial [Stylosanthes scabra]|nr:hypothetical protein [Stylosanthes scabra]
MSKLEHLEIDSKAVKWLISNRGKWLMNSLKQLHLIGWQSHGETLYSFLHTIPNLQILEMRTDSNIREFVPSGNTAPKQRLGSVLLLKEFTLSFSFIEDIGFERDPALQRSLHRLVLLYCHKLTRLAHSSVSFTHLTYLEVYFCSELRTLITCSTAKSLVQLTTIKVVGCYKLNEIVTNDEANDDKEIKIVFAKLITIEFEGLRNLTSFCSNGNCEFSMPLLEKLILTDCPKMKRFTAKLITTPKLPSVLVSERYGEEEIERGYWEGDLNGTLQIDKVAKFVRKVKELKLGEHPRIHGIWNAPFPVPSLCFIRLKILIVEKCEFTSVVIPSHILCLLCKLEELVVRQCDSVKAIFEVTHEAKDAQINSLRSSLKKLTIEQLPNLEHVWDSDPTQHISCFHSFQQVYVHGCNNLESLFPASVAENLTKLEKLEVTNCDKLVEIVAKDEAAVEGAPKEFALQSMTSIKLWTLPELKCFYPALHKLECPKLEEVHLFHCDKL